MPQLSWLPEALQDLDRLHGFLREKSPTAACRAMATIRLAADALEARPEVGKPVDHDRREWFIAFGAGAYVLRYRIDPDGNPVVIRVWHSRENRG